MKNNVLLKTLMKSNLIYYLIASLLLFILGCSDSKPKSPEEKTFAEANSKITVYVHADSGAYGNTDTARAAALQFAKLSRSLERMIFTGGREDGISLTNENFVTYCRINKESAVFLVHVPQLKNYKDDVRDNLIRMCWISAKTAIKDKLPANSELAVALRGSIFYGGMAIGKLVGQPAITNSSIVNTDSLYKYFKN